MPTIKREESPEPPIASVASTVSPELSVHRSEASAGPSSSHARNTKPTMPLPKPYIAAKQAHLAPAAYYGSSPRKYKLPAGGNGSALISVPTPPVFSRLPSRLGSAMATGRVNNKTTATATTGRSTRTTTLPNITRLTQRLKHTSYPEGNAIERSRGMMDPDHVDFPQMLLNEEDDEMVLVSRAELDELRYHLDLLQNEHAASANKVHHQSELIMELVAFNQQTHETIQDLNTRLRSVEIADAFGLAQEQHGEMPVDPLLQLTYGHRGAGDARSRSPSQERQDYRQREMPGNFRNGSFRKGNGRSRTHLQISIPGKLYAPPSVGLPTPKTSSAIAPTAPTPKTPLTPGRIGPPSGKRTNTCINKRGIHNLDKMVPPTYAQLPLLPLTDTELIVYFFNSLSRPIVSLRLYGRGWGPAAICQTINTHRIVEPEYLRNTCSVKCTTAIKKGRDKYGADWETENRAIFGDKDNTTDEEATDMIRLDKDELAIAPDFELRALCHGLRKHPGPADGGIFTQCVEYCEANDAAYKLSDVWKLASDLVTGRVPNYSPVSQTSNVESSPRSASVFSGASVITKNKEPTSSEST